MIAMVVAVMNLWIPHLSCNPYLTILHHKDHWPRLASKSLVLALVSDTSGLGLEDH